MANGRRVGDGRRTGKAYPRQVRWKLDQDYVGSLPPTERDWLARFNDAHYGGTFEPGDGWSPEARRETWANKSAGRDDVYARAGESRLDTLEKAHEGAAPPEADLSPTPAYLDDGAYKAALAEFRSHLSQTRATTQNQIRNPSETPEYKAALEKLTKEMHLAKRRSLYRARRTRPSPSESGD